MNREDRLQKGRPLLNFNPADTVRRRENYLGVILKLNSPGIIGNESS